MDTLVLRSDLQEAVKQDAEQEARSISEIVNEAVEQYLLERQLAKLETEIAAFKAMHPELWRKYSGEWVAIHERKLIGHDPDGTALYRRIRAEYGQRAVLIRQVTEQIVDDIWVRTPNTGRIMA